MWSRAWRSCAAPQATLYGANSTAGVIVIKTKGGKQGGMPASASKRVRSTGARCAGLTIATDTELGGGEPAVLAEPVQDRAATTSTSTSTSMTTLQAAQGRVRDRIASSVGGSFWKSENDFGYAELDEAIVLPDRSSSYWSFQTPRSEPAQQETGQTIGSVLLRLAIQRRRTAADGSRGSHGDRLLDRRSERRSCWATRWRLPRFPLAATRHRRSALRPARRCRSTTRRPIVAAFYEDQRYAGRVRARLQRVALQSHGWARLSEAGRRSSGVRTACFAERRLVQVGLHERRPEAARQPASSSRSAFGWMTTRAGARRPTGNAGFSWQIAQAAQRLCELRHAASSRRRWRSSSTRPYGVSTLLAGKRAHRRGRHSRRLALDERLSVEASYWNTQLDDVIFFDYSIANPVRPDGLRSVQQRCRRQNLGRRVEGGVPAVRLHRRVRQLHLHGLRATGLVGADWMRTVQIAAHKGNVGVNYGLERLSLGTNAYYSGPRLRWAGISRPTSYVRLDMSGRYPAEQGSVSLAARGEPARPRTISRSWATRRRGATRSSAANTGSTEERFMRHTLASAASVSRPDHGPVPDGGRAHR